MSELLLSDGQNTTVLPQTDEEKARQVPDPVTYHLLCVLPKAEEEYESGLAKAGQTSSSSYFRSAKLKKPSNRASSSRNN